MYAAYTTECSASDGPGTVVTTAVPYQTPTFHPFPPVGICQFGNLTRLRQQLWPRPPLLEVSLNVSCVYLPSVSISGRSLADDSLASKVR